MATARSRGAHIRSNVFAYANLAPYVFFVLFPFYFMVVTSFKSNAELYNLKSIPFWIQTGAIMDHYALLFQKTDFVTWMKNSLLVAADVNLSVAGRNLGRHRIADAPQMLVARTQQHHQFIGAADRNRRFDHQ